MEDFDRGRGSKAHRAPVLRPEACLPAPGAELRDRIHGHDDIGPGFGAAFESLETSGQEQSAVEGKPAFDRDRDPGYPEGRGPCEKGVNVSCRS
jgi:hypothetical protein